MTRVRLEIDEVQIHRPKKRWKLYFLVVTDHPTEEDKMILTTLPHQPFKLSRRHDNSFQFDTDDAGSNGLFVLSRDLPEDRELNVHIYLRHTRKATRDLGEILKDVEEYAPLKRIGTTDEVAGAVILLASDPGAFITGQVITMDGGVTIAGRG